MTSTKPEARKRLTPPQQHALKTLPSRIATLTSEIAVLQKALADPALFTRDRARFDRSSEAISAKSGQLEQAETEWLELEMLREEVGG